MADAVVDVTEALAVYYAAAGNDRGDEGEAHVSDLYKCDLETWYRRNGGKMIPFSLETRLKFAMGNVVEEEIAKALHPQGFSKRDRIEYEGLVGHLDLDNAMIGVVAEVKSTTFWQKKMPDGTYRREPPVDKYAVSFHYRVQGAGYAIARGYERFVIIIVCRESGMVADYWYGVDEQVDPNLYGLVTYRQLIAQRIAQVLERTAPGAEAPPAAPPRYADTKKGNWLCNYCRNPTCEKNRNPEAMAV